MEGTRIPAEGWGLKDQKIKRNVESLMGISRQMGGSSKEKNFLFHGGGMDSLLLQNMNVLQILE